MFFNSQPDKLLVVYSQFSKPVEMDFNSASGTVTTCQTQEQVNNTGCATGQG